MTTKQIIEKRLKATRKCGFKNAWIPKGWACVNIETFSKELAQELNKK